MDGCSSSCKSCEATDEGAAAVVARRDHLDVVGTCDQNLEVPWVVLRALPPISRNAIELIEENRVDVVDALLLQ